MGFTIEDGTGKGNSVKINTNNRMFVNSIQKSEDLSATDIGNSYNINTGILNFSSGTTASALLYLKNNEDQNLIIDSFAVGIGKPSGTANQQDIPVITLVRNPTGGGIVGSALPVAQNQNRNFGSSKTLTADIYAGSNTFDVTGGDNIAQFFQGVNGRLFASIGFELTKGDSAALTINPMLNAGSFSCYGAFICHLTDADEQ